MSCFMFDRPLYRLNSGQFMQKFYHLSGFLSMCYRTEIFGKFGASAWLFIENLTKRQGNTPHPRASFARSYLPPTGEGLVTLTFAPNISAWQRHSTSAVFARLGTSLGNPFHLFIKNLFPVVRAESRNNTDYTAHDNSKTEKNSLLVKPHPNMVK